MLSTIGVFDHTSYFVTVGLSNTVQLRLLGNYSGILKILEPILCCLVRHFLLFFFPSSFTESDLYNEVSSATAAGKMKNAVAEAALQAQHEKTTRCADGYEGVFSRTPSITALSCDVLKF